MWNLVVKGTQQPVLAQAENPETLEQDRDNLVREMNEAFPDFTSKEDYEILCISDPSLPDEAYRIEFRVDEEECVRAAAGDRDRMVQMVSSLLQRYPSFEEIRITKLPFTLDAKEFER